MQHVNARAWPMLVCCVAALSGCSGSIHDAVGRMDRARVEAMLARDPSLVHSVRSKGGKTPLHHAATYGAHELIGVLVDHGADLDARDQTGLTALHVAAMIGRERETKLLVELGADVGVRDWFGDTALYSAALHGQGEIVVLLARAGADLWTKNYDGNTPMEAARARGHARVVEYIEAIEECDD